MASVINAEYHSMLYVKCGEGECQYAECRYAKCRATSNL
jgi:hypothetical protein